MMWIKNSEQLRTAWNVSWKRFVDAKWIYKNENGKWHTKLHDAMNILAELNKADPYFGVHWFVVLSVLAYVIGVFYWWISPLFIIVFFLTVWAWKKYHG